MWNLLVSDDAAWELWCDAVTICPVPAMSLFLRSHACWLFSPVPLLMLTADCFYSYSMQALSSSSMSGNWEPFSLSLSPQWVPVLSSVGHLFVPLIISNIVMFHFLFSSLMHLPLFWLTGLLPTFMFFTINTFCINKPPLFCGGCYSGSKLNKDHIK